MPADETTSIIPTNDTGKFKYRQNKFSSGESLWEAVGKDYEKGTAETAKSISGWNEENLVAMLIAESFNDERLLLTSETLEDSFLLRSIKTIYQDIQRLIRFFWRHLFDIIIIGSVLLLLAGLVRWIVKTAASYKTQQVVVERKDGLPVFYKIDSSDLKIEARLNSGRNLSDIKEVADRFTVKEIKKDEVLTESDLLPREFTEQIKNSHIMSIPVRTDSLNSAIKATTKIGLLFSNKQLSKENSVLIKNVLLLKIEKAESGKILVVAMTPEQVETVKNLLASFEIFIVQN